jgi:PhzF family phenazine biosynthesis protein
LHPCAFIKEYEIMKKQNTIYQVDAFSSVPFKGNPAGVCILDYVPQTEWMKNIAMEMNLSETAFVFPGKGGLNIRFFSPESEVPLCGHATLSASHILYETGAVRSTESINLLSKAGELIINKQGEWVTMNFPKYDLQKIESDPEFEKVTGIKPLELHKAGFGWVLALLENEEEVKNLKPLFHQMKDSKFGDLIITAKSKDPNFDFCVRCFAPALGINEDPVTGSAHCALVPFWAERTGKTEFISHQVSKREGILKVRLKGDRVEISGQARTILKAELFV